MSNSPLLIMIQDISDSFFLRFGDLPLVIPVVVLSVVGGVIGVIEIHIPFIAPIVVSVPVIQVKKRLHLAPSFSKAS